MELAGLLQNVPVLSVDSRIGEVHGIASDSRRVRPGDIFLCVRGRARDGHDFVQEALQRGAAAVLCEADVPLPADCAAIRCADTRLAEAMLWNNWYGNPAGEMQAVAITGTAGKTTTAWILRNLLSHAGKRVGVVTTLGTLAGNRTVSVGENGGSSVSDAAGAMTTPDPEYFYGAIAEMRRECCDTLVYEASSHALALRKTDAIQPDIGIFTNLSTEHMDYHVSMEAYLRAKVRLFALAKQGIVNYDDPACERLMALSGRPASYFRTCTAREENMYTCWASALRIQCDGREGVSFLYYGEDAIFRVKTAAMTGLYSVYNLTEAICAALALQVDPLCIKETLEGMQSVPGRMERIQNAEWKPPFDVYIDYAHTPAALEAVLRAAKAQKPVKLTVLFGCGGDRDRGKRPIMGKIAETYADTVILTDDNPRFEEPDRIFADILSGMQTKAEVIPDRRAAIRTAIQNAVPGEVLLLCGKGHEKYEIRNGKKLPFDETKLVRDALTERYGGAGGAHSGNL